MDDNKRAFAYLVPVILLWASTPLAVSKLTETIHPFLVNFIASGFAVLAFALVITLRKGWSRLFSVGAKSVAIMAGLGAIGIFPYATLYYLAFSLAPAASGDVNIVNYLWPIWIIILSLPILKEKLSIVKAAGVLLSFAGVYLIISGGGTAGFQKEYIPAYLSAGAGAFFWGLFSVLTKKFRFPAIEAMLVYNASAFACFGLLVLISSAAGSLGLRETAILAFLGAGVNGLGYLFWILALASGETGKISATVYIVPFVALVYIWIFRGTAIRLYHLIALTLIVGGPLIQTWVKPRRRPLA